MKLTKTAQNVNVNQQNSNALESSVQKIAEKPLEQLKEKATKYLAEVCLCYN
jgi:hypothetical protein